MGTEFRPIADLVRRHEATADRWVTVAVARPGGCEHLSLGLHRDGAMAAADEEYALLLVKTALWLRGGCTLLTADEAVYRWLQGAYAPTGARAFDRAFLSGIYRSPFQVERRQTLPPERETPASAAARTEGCRIGIDLGGSDRKAAAVIDGETVYTEEVVWQPKTASDLRYHYEGITAALRSAKAHLPRVDSVGISTAGVVIDGEIRRSSLFMGVEQATYDRLGRDLLARAVRETCGNVPWAASNDGDVAALAGAVSLGRRKLLGIALGTSEAGGYVDGSGRITGRLHELAFLPVDVNPLAPVDPWSGDRGVGERYFSQEGVLRLAGLNGLTPEGETPAEKLRWVQDRARAGESRAIAAFSELGRLLGLTLPWYQRLTGCESVLLLGRVVDGVGGECLVDSCRAALESTGAALEILLPEASQRRVGQAAAAAFLNSTLNSTLKAGAI